MKKYSYILFIGIALVLSSCGDNTENKKEDQSQEEHNHSEDAIQLNDGKKWKVVDEMMGYIRSMESDIAALEDQDVKDYNALADLLDNNINLLTSNCTMTGKAHDELHKWLVPYIGMVEDLSESKSYEESREIYTNIQASLKMFNTYFE